MAKPKAAPEPEIHNRKARHDYTISDTLECGIKLTGTEVKAIRAGRASIAEGYVRAEEDPPTLTLFSAHIDEYPPAGAAAQHAPTRSRPLLAHKREIRKLARAAAEKGVTLVPLKMYFKEGRIKLLVGVGKGKKQHDKRSDIKKRDAQRDIERALARERR
jgi:SsrA-binding protein